MLQPRPPLSKSPSVQPTPATPPQHGLAETCAELRLPLHLFAWQPAMQNAGLCRSALYLICPDGYIALADPHGQPNTLRKYHQAQGSLLGD